MGKIRYFEKSYWKWVWKLFGFWANFFTFLPPFPSDVRNTLNFHRKCSIFFLMACLHIVLSIINIVKLKKIWENIFFSQNVKKITFFKISGTEAVCLPMVEKCTFQQIKQLVIGSYYKLYMYFTLYLSTNHET